MKLFQITVLDDMDEISYLKVLDKNEDEIKKEIEEKSDDYSCFMWCSVTEVAEVDGYKITLSKD